MSDIIERYNLAERSGRASVPNSAIRAFGLDLWAHQGYPHRIDSLSELWRYHDSMQDGRFETNLSLLGTVSGADLELCARATDAVAQFALARFGVANPARDALSRAILQYRILLDHAAGNKVQMTVLEVGPGSGYLGLLLGLAGHQYLAVEASQAFYVYQHELWSTVFGSEYSDGLAAADLRRIQHIPWWAFNAENFKLPILDIATCNHALAEMNPLAVKRFFHVVRRFGSKSVLVIAESLGRRHYSTEEVVGSVLQQRFDLREKNNDVWIMSPAIDSSPGCQRVVRPNYWSNNRLIRAIINSPMLGKLLRSAYEQIVARRALPKSENVASTTRSNLGKVFEPYPIVKSADLRYQNNEW